MKPIFIIGYMACGKTTFGRALARQTGCRFIDLDFYIEQRFRKPIKEIFSERGEAEFRRIETAMLREIGEFEDVVIACGGGTPCFNDNMDYMLGQGTTIFLEASPERIVERLQINNSRRPLMAGKSGEQLMADAMAGLLHRLPHYRRAHITFSGEHLENRREIDSSVAGFLRKHPELGTINNNLHLNCTDTNKSDMNILSDNG